MALLFASVDLNLAIYYRAAARHAVRQGARFAATGATLSEMNQDASIRQVVKSNSFGVLNFTGADALIQIRYYDPITGAETASNAQGNLVTVSLTGFQRAPLGPLMRPGGMINLDSTAVSAVEPYPGTPPTR